MADETKPEEQKPPGEAKPDPREDPNANHVVVLEPASDKLKWLQGALEKREEAVVHMAATQPDLLQISMRFSPCLVFLSAKDQQELIRAVSVVTQLAIFIKRKIFRVIVVSRIDNRAVVDNLLKLGVSEFILDSLPHNTLLFKTGVQLKALRASRAKKEKELSLKEGQGGKTEENKGPVTITGTGEAPICEVGEDMWIFRGQPPQKLGSFWVSDVEGPDPESGEWVESGSEGGQKKYSWKSKLPDGTTPPGNRVREGWEFTGAKPTFNKESGKWKLFSSQPDLSYKKGGKKQGSKMWVDPKTGKVMVAKDSPQADKNIAKSKQIAERARERAEEEKKKAEVKAKEAEDRKKKAEEEKRARDEKDQALKQKRLEQEEANKKRLAERGEINVREGEEGKKPEKADNAGSAEKAAKTQAAAKEKPTARAKMGFEKDEAGDEKDAAKKKRRGFEKDEDEEDDEAGAKKRVNPFAPKEGAGEGGEKKKNPFEPRQETGETKKRESPFGKKEGEAEERDEDEEEDEEGAAKGGQAKGPKKKRVATAAADATEEPEEEKKKKGGAEEAKKKGLAWKPSVKGKRKVKRKKILPSGEEIEEEVEEEIEEDGEGGGEGGGEGDEEAGGPAEPGKAAAKAREAKARKAAEAKAKPEARKRALGENGGAKDDEEEAGLPRPEAGERAATKDLVDKGPEGPDSYQGAIEEQAKRRAWRARALGNESVLDAGKDREREKRPKKRREKIKGKKRGAKEKGEDEEETKLEIPGGEFGNLLGSWKETPEGDHVFVTPEMTTASADEIRAIAPFWYLEEPAERPIFHTAKRAWLFDERFPPKKAESFAVLPEPIQRFLLESIARSLDDAEAAAKAKESLKEAIVEAKEKLEKVSEEAPEVEVEIEVNAEGEDPDAPDAEKDEKGSKPVEARIREKGKDAEAKKKEIAERMKEQIEARKRKLDEKKRKKDEADAEVAAKNAERAAEEERKKKQGREEDGEDPLGAAGGADEDGEATRKKKRGADDGLGPDGKKKKGTADEDDDSRRKGSGLDAEDEGEAKRAKRGEEGSDWNDEAADDDPTGKKRRKKRKGEEGDEELEPAPRSGPVFHLAIVNWIHEGRSVDAIHDWISSRLRAEHEGARRAAILLPVREGVAVRSFRVLGSDESEALAKSPDRYSNGREIPLAGNPALAGAARERKRKTQGKPECMVVAAPVLARDAFVASEGVPADSLVAVILLELPVGADESALSPLFDQAVRQVAQLEAGGRGAAKAA